MRQYNLHNRYGVESFLQETTNNVWVLNYKNPEELSSIRVIYEDSERKRVQAIDPSGGPMLSVGATLEIGTIRAISLVDVDDKRSVWTLLIE